MTRLRAYKYPPAASQLAAAFVREYFIPRRAFRTEL